MNPPDIRLIKSDRTAARTDSKGMTMALNDRYTMIPGHLLVWTAPDGIKRARMRSL